MQQSITQFNQELQTFLVQSLQSIKTATTGHYYYLLSIYNNLNNKNSPHQLMNELALSLMLSNDLLANGWKQIRSPLTINDNGCGGNWWEFERNQTKLEIVVGDTYKGTNPNWVITDHINLVHPTNTISFLPEIYGLHENVVTHQYNNQLPTKLFNCFMSAATSYRQYCFYELVRRNLLQDGAISYLLNSQQDPVNNRDSCLSRYQALKHDPLNDIFDHEHDLMIDQVPFKNFTTTLEQAIADSKISLVIETDCHDQHEIFLTEKTFRALLMPRPCFLFVPGYKTGVVKYLRRLGFDMYDDIIDHSYDNEEHPVYRLTNILEQIENFRCFEYTPEILINFKLRADRNLELVRQLRNNLPQRYQTVLNQIQQIEY